MPENMLANFPDFIRKPENEVETEWEGFRGYMFQSPNGSQVVFWECDIEIKAPPHKHDYEEYCLVVEGTCMETIEGVTHVLNAGDECVIPAGKMHWSTMGPKYRAIDVFGGPRCKYKNR